MNNKAIELYTWKANKLNQSNPKVILKKMIPINFEYDSEENAKQLARLLSESIPSNTLDVFYDHIAQSIGHMIDWELPFINDNQDVSTRIRTAVSLLNE